MTKYLQSKPGSIEELAANMTSQVSESDYQQKFKKELEKAGKGIGAMTPAEKKAFFNKIDKKYKAKDEEIKESIDEKKNYKYDRNFFVNDKTDTLKKMTGRQGYNKSTLTDYLAQKSNKKEDDVYFDDTDLVYKDKTVMKNAETKTVDQMLKALQKEAVDNPYAVGMAQAMKKTGDKPPLKKSTITKAHDIAKSIEKDQKEELNKDDETAVKKVKDMLKKASQAHAGQAKELDKAMKSEEVKYPHKMYSKDGKEVEAKTPADHEKYAKMGYTHQKEEVKEARWEIEGRVSYKNVGPEDSFHMVIDAPTKDAAERKAYAELDKARQRRKIGPGGGGSIEDADIESIERTNDRLSPPEADFMGNSYDPTQKEEVKEAKVDELTAAQKKLPPALQKAIKKKEDAKEEVEETHSYVTNKQNQKQKDAKGEKEIVDPKPKMKKPSMNEQTAKQQSLMKAIYDVWSNSATDLEEVKKNAKYMKSSKDDVSTEVDAEQKKKEEEKKSKENEVDRLKDQVTLLKQKLENEKHKAVKPEPNPDTGEVPLTVGVAYKHMKDKMKNNESDDENKKRTEKKMSVSPTKTKVDTSPSVDYKA